MRQRTIATATSYFWRFYLKDSFIDHEPTAIAVVCVSLASKVEENPIHDHGKLLHLAKKLSECIYSAEIALPESQLLALELQVLEELGCNLSIFDPYTPLQNYLNDVSSTEVLKLAWGSLNDSLVR